LKKEQEREQKRKEELKQAEERRQKEREDRDKARDQPRSEQQGGHPREQRDQHPRGPRRDEAPRREAPPKSDKEVEIDSRSSWRSDRKGGDDAPRGRGGFGGGRGGGGGGPRGGGAGHKAPEKRWLEDSDGFKTKKEEPKPAHPQTGGSWAAVAGKPAAEDAKSAANPYDALNGGDE